MMMMILTRTMKDNDCGAGYDEGNDDDDGDDDGDSDDDDEEEEEEEERTSIVRPRMRSGHPSNVRGSMTSRPAFCSRSRPE